MKWTIILLLALGITAMPSTLMWSAPVLSLEITSVGFKVRDAEGNSTAQAFGGFEAILVDTKTDLELRSDSSIFSNGLVPNAAEAQSYAKRILENLGCTPQKGTNSGKIGYRGPCKYRTLWIDLAGDGSPNGREFMKNLADIIARTNAIEIVPAKKQAQAAYYFQHAEYQEPASNSSSGWVSVAWKVVVKNQTDRTIRLMGRIKFLDADGYVVDLDLFTGYIDGGQSHTFTGLLPMPESDAERIESARAGIADYS